VWAERNSARKHHDAEQIEARTPGPFFHVYSLNF
jgi:hypothetical protein